MIHLEQGIVFFRDLDDIIKLSLIGGLQAQVKALGIILQQADKDVFLLADVGDSADFQLGLRNIQGVLVVACQAEIEQSATLQPQVAPTALLFECLHCQINPVEIK